LLLVVGSVAIDTIELPDALERERLGGSATYAALAARLFHEDVALVGIVGDDFPSEFLRTLQESGIVLDGLTQSNIPSFRWHGRYQRNMNIRETVSVTPEILMGFQPELPDGLRDADVVLLANCAPQLQKCVLRQIRNPKLVLLDTMDIWIKNEREELFSLLENVDILLINDEEARLIYKDWSLLNVIERIVELGVGSVVVKKGAEGVLALFNDDCVSLPAFPLRSVYDPTGAGDVFAGVLAGCLASAETMDAEEMKKALALATVTASFCCESCGADRFAHIDLKDVNERLETFRRMVSF